jgi:SAM-dependent methyltransferase
MELQILKHLRNNEIYVNQSNVLDIGSGSGHWIDFYKTLEAGNVTGMDVSHSSFKHLKQKYSEDTNVAIHRGKALEVICNLNGDYDLVNAVGVMFHIVDDSEWQDTISSVANKLKNNGLFIIGGHFGFSDGLNVQIDKDGNINKRLRSKRHWVNTLKRAGFSNVKVYRNYSYLWIKDTLPENNVLIATK